LDVHSFTPLRLPIYRAVLRAAEPGNKSECDRVGKLATDLQDTVGAFASQDIFFRRKKTRSCKQDRVIRLGGELLNVAGMNVAYTLFGDDLIPRANRFRDCQLCAR